MSPGVLCSNILLPETPPVSVCTHTMLFVLRMVLFHLQQGKVIFNDVVDDSQDCCHVQLDINAGLEPKLLAVVMKRLCLIWLYGALQALSALPMLPNC